MRAWLAFGTVEGIRDTVTESAMPGMVRVFVACCG